MEILLVAVAIGLIPAAVAHSKGANFFAWWFFGAMLWIVALPMALLMKDRRKEAETARLAAEAAATTRKCPTCAERIQREAIVCRYCGRDVPPLSEPLAKDLEGQKPPNKPIVETY